jgi:hypothetical protein
MTFVLQMPEKCERYDGLTCIGGRKQGCPHDRNHAPARQRQETPRNQHRNSENPQNGDGYDNHSEEDETDAGYRLDAEVGSVARQDKEDSGNYVEWRSFQKRDRYSEHEFPCTKHDHDSAIECEGEADYLAEWFAEYVFCDLYQILFRKGR